MLTYADVCRRMPTHADVCWRMPTYADVCRHMLTYADVCWRMQAASCRSPLNVQGAGAKVGALLWPPTFRKGRCGEGIYICVPKICPKNGGPPLTANFMCPHAPILLSVCAYCYTAMCVLLYCYLCPHTAILPSVWRPTSCVRILLYCYLCAHTAICVCILLYCYVCPHTAICYCDVLTYADVYCDILTYADVCWRMLTYADVCWRMLTYADVCFCYMLLRYAMIESAYYYIFSSFFWPPTCRQGRYICVRMLF
jgi:hypothetical protein